MFQSVESARLGSGTLVVGLVLYRQREQKEVSANAPAAF